MNDLVKAHTDLSDDDVAWLNLLLADWQIIEFKPVMFAEGLRSVIEGQNGQ